MHRLPRPRAPRQAQRRLLARFVAFFRERKSLAVSRLQAAHTASEEDAPTAEPEHEVAQSSSSDDEPDAPSASGPAGKASEASAGAGEEVKNDGDDAEAFPETELDREISVASSVLSTGPLSASRAGPSASQSLSRSGACAFVCIPSSSAHEQAVDC
jgi:hypothetical protein